MRNSLRTWKKIWSSTQWEIGPMPLAQSMSAAVPTRAPYIPLDGLKPKHKQVSTAKQLSDFWTMRPCHPEGVRGIVRYASETSQIAACKPGGRCHIRWLTMSKVPYVHEKLSELMQELMDAFLGSLKGKNKFCIRRNFLGLPGFGITESGEDWKGPSANSISARKYGPR